VPVTPEDRARMLQPDDMAALILFVATRPGHVCLKRRGASPGGHPARSRDSRSG
jgi:NADP-dependent 3-hydroxy acid dehydrogenase YdfG